MHLREKAHRVGDEFTHFKVHLVPANSVDDDVAGSGILVGIDVVEWEEGHRSFGNDGPPGIRSGSAKSWEQHHLMFQGEIIDQDRNVR